MADIAEVIHRINYEVNDTGLQRISEIIRQQVSELNTLNNVLRTYQQQLTGVKDAAGLNELSRKMDNVTKQIENSGAKAKGILEQIFSGVLKGIGADTKLEDAVANWLKPLWENLLGIGAAGAGAASALGKFGGVVPVVISLVAALEEELTESSDAAKRMARSIEEVGEKGRKIGDYASDEMARLFTLRSRIEDVNTSYDDRKIAMGELLSLYPQYFEKLNEEEILAGKVGDAYEKVVRNIVARAKLDVLNEQLKATISKLESLKAQINKIDPNKQMHEQGIGFQDYGYPSLKGNDEIGGRNGILEIIAQYNRERLALQSVLFEISDTQKLIDKTPRQTGGNGSSTLPKSRKSIPEIDRISPTGVKPLPVEKGTDVSFSKADAPDVKFSESWFPSKFESFLFGDDAWNEDKTERHQAELQKTGEAFKSLANTAVQAFQTINDAQIKALDKEIEIRQKRVDAATKLAERGNTDALKMEQQRLDETIKKREAFARRQQMINAALAVTDAILAVANAASQTGPGAIVVVPAVIAAIVAGYAAITAATKESSAQAFADGVVGFQGKGGPREDANWVRISSGESVITAAGTAANRHILEAINNGTQFRMLDMPMLNVPAVVQGGSTSYASQASMKNLEKKLDGVITAIEDNRFRQDIYFNEQGVGMMTQRAIKRDQNRYR